MDTQTFLPYAQPSISSEDIEFVSRSLATPVITRGPTVETFENAIAAFCGAKYGVAFTNATAALMAAYHVANIGPTDRIITTPNSFIASIGPGIQKNATPIFLDINRNTGNIDLEQLEININRPSSRGKTVIVPVHFAGIPVDMKIVDKLIKNPDTIVIEDAAHAIGSRYHDGSPVGCCAWSHMTVFSFHPAKTLTTGEGGMVMTNNDDLCHMLRRYRNNGIERDPRYIQGEEAPWYYEVVDFTGNFNFTEMQAALGLSQLNRLDQFVAQRQKLMKRYVMQLAGMKGMRLFTPDENLHIAYHLCVVQIDFNVYKTSRTALMQALKDQGIGSQLHYIPLYRHPFFTRKSGDISEYFPEMEAYYAQALSLPLFYDMTEANVDRVVNAVKNALQHSCM